jgi:hypothetical protein
LSQPNRQPPTCPATMQVLHFFLSLVVMDEKHQLLVGDCDQPFAPMARTNL